MKRKSIPQATIDHAVASILALDPRIKVAVVYDRKDKRFERLSHVQGVYAAFVGSEPLYVGMGTVASRIESHMKAMRRKRSDGWHKRVKEGVDRESVFWVVGLVDGDYQTVQHVEVTLIYLLRPRGNAMFSGSSGTNFWKNVWEPMERSLQGYRPDPPAAYTWKKVRPFPNAADDHRSPPGRHVVRKDLEE